MVDEQNLLPAGCFSSWLRRTRLALFRGTGANVHCGNCIACCSSSYFIHIRPDETETIRHIPKELLFKAPGLPKGNVLMGYDQFGRCPMLIDGKCSIYAYRSQTCRVYDCRIFAASGIAAGDDDKTLINKQVQRWRFSYPTRRDFEQHQAVKVAAMFLKESSNCFPSGAVPSLPTQLAIMAIKVYQVFLHENKHRSDGEIPKDTEVAKLVLKANQAFNSRRDNIVMKEFD